MAKKSNKTEHVLSLITKGDEPAEAMETQAAEAGIQECEVTVSLRDDQEKELRIERKLTVEIEPDIRIKGPDHASDELSVKAPGMERGQGGERHAFLLNLTERLVADMVDDVMQKTNVCTCPVCKNDVMALALNSLSQNYVTSDAGKQYLQLDFYKKQHETDVLAALIKACVRVKAAPKH